MKTDLETKLKRAEAALRDIKRQCEHAAGVPMHPNTTLRCGTVHLAACKGLGIEHSSYTSAAFLP
jgi:hypothetical protein